jgi:hypothetical protein
MPPQSPTQQLLIGNNSSSSHFNNVNDLISQPISPSLSNNNISNSQNTQSSTLIINNIANNNLNTSQSFLNDSFNISSSPPNSSNLNQGNSPSQSSVNFQSQQQMSINNMSSTLLSNSIPQSIMVNQQQMQHHVHMQPLRICSSCNLSIRDRYLLQCVDRYWHVQCLRCQVCKVTLSDVGEKCFSRDQMILCRNDYFKMYGGRCIGGKCDSCTKPILGNEQVMRAFNSVYHVDCFVCQICRIKLKTGDKFCYSNGRIFCEKDNPSNSNNINSQLNNQILNGGSRQNIIQPNPLIGLNTQIIPNSQNNLLGSSPPNNNTNKRANNNGAKRSKATKTSLSQQQQHLNQHQINLHQQMNVQNQQQLLYQDDQTIQLHQQIIN